MEPDGRNMDNSLLENEVRRLQSAVDDRDHLVAHLQRCLSDERASKDRLALQLEETVSDAERNLELLSSWHCVEFNIVLEELALREKSVRFLDFWDRWAEVKSHFDELFHSNLSASNSLARQLLETDMLQSTVSFVGVLPLAAVSIQAMRLIRTIVGEKASLQEAAHHLQAHCFSLWINGAEALMDATRVQKQAHLELLKQAHDTFEPEPDVAKLIEGIENDMMSLRKDFCQQQLSAITALLAAEEAEARAALLSAVQEERTDFVASRSLAALAMEQRFLRQEENYDALNTRLLNRLAELEHQQRNSTQHHQEELNNLRMRERQLERQLACELSTHSDIISRLQREFNKERDRNSAMRHFSEMTLALEKEATAVFLKEFFQENLERATLVAGTHHHLVVLLEKASASAASLLQQLGFERGEREELLMLAENRQAELVLTYQQQIECLKESIQRPLGEF